MVHYGEGLGTLWRGHFTKGDGALGEAEGLAGEPAVLVCGLLLGLELPLQVPRRPPL